MGFTFRGADFSRAGGHGHGKRENARDADVVLSGFHWQKKQLPTPGAGNFAFESLGLPQQSPIGPAVCNRSFLMVVQPGQLYMRGIVTPVSGVGGLVAGTVRGQPLYDPNTKTYGGVR